MPTFQHIIAFFGLLLLGCTSLEMPSTLRPAPHPYAEPIASWSDFDPLPAQAVAIHSRTTKAERLQVRRLLRQQLFALKGRRNLGHHPRTGLGLAKRVFERYQLPSAPHKANNLDALWRKTAPIDGQPAPGDLVFLTGEAGTPQLGIVRRVVGRHTLEFATYYRGQVSFLRASPRYPDVRRQNGSVYNSFVRQKRPGDAKGTRYLAGQYLIGIRTPLR